ncbi:hypothetical protein BJ878DRAFT_510222 [Calycina marina]|uniref:MARVEL domain-containing protein n=1 Tax=Calycina marina TaxID=1763456 RepID=A0A9P7Z1V3_9HELO|nr:hypothetical protein BJ878DRAFT_510222 [Calycina marina]
MGIKDAFEFTLGTIIHTIFRFIQLVLALTVCGLYGVDLHKSNSEDKYSDGKWIYAEVVASLSAFTALFYMIPFTVKITFAFVWDTILFILWIALFGLFGSMYIKEHAEGDNGVQRMKNAVWVDLTNALLWLISAVGMAFYWVKHRHGRSIWTGRAKV